MTTTLNVGAGTGYSDVSPKQVVRTSANRAYLVAIDCASYPCTASGQTVRVYKANATGVPASFARQDSANEPADAGVVGCAIDGSDNIHLAWYDRNGGSNSRIRYAVFATSTDTWGTKEIVDADLGASLPDGGQGDQMVTIALDGNGVPHVAYLYHDGTRRRLAYRHRIGGTWSSLTNGIDDNTYTGNRKAWHPNLAFDTSGRRVFAWSVGAFNGDVDGQQCVRVMDTDDSLGTRVDVGTATAKVGIDQSTSLLCTGTIHVTWILGTVGGGNDEYVRYAYATESKNPSFSTNHPANADTHNPSLGPGASGAIRIYGHGSEGGAGDDNLYYWEGAGGAGAWSGRTAYASGTFDSSVSTRWAQSFYTNPTHLDTVFWDQDYPNDLYYSVDVVAEPPPPIVRSTRVVSL